MYRDTYIKLVLKEFLNDPYLVRFIYQILDNVEIIEAKDKSSKISEPLRNDIQLLYPGLIKTALFETSKFTIDNDLDPGYSFYNVKSLTPCGYVVEWNHYPPSQYKISIHDVNRKRKRKTNSISIINHIHKKNDQDFINKLLKKRNRYHKAELIGKKPGTALWYDFENKFFVHT